MYSPCDNERNEPCDLVRWERWKVASASVAPIMKRTDELHGSVSQFLALALDGLGRLDAKLIYTDQILIQKRAQGRGGGVVSDHLTLSYLWVLGSYEALRTMHEWLSSDDDPDKNNVYPQDMQDRVKQLKQKFAKLRMPLAKFQVQGKKVKAIAYPGIHCQYGVAWQISETEIISRTELSEALLDLLEQMRGVFKNGTK